MPEGATITGVTADMFASDGYDVRLQRRTSSGFGESAVVIASASGGSTLANVEADLTPAGAPHFCASAGAPADHAALRPPIVPGATERAVHRQ